jgi:hypothetical protein
MSSGVICHIDARRKAKGDNDFPILATVAASEIGQERAERIDYVAKRLSREFDWLYDFVGGCGAIAGHSVVVME